MSRVAMSPSPFPGISVHINDGHDAAAAWATAEGFCFVGLKLMLKGMFPPPLP